MSARTKIICKIIIKHFNERNPYVLISQGVILSDTEIFSEMVLMT